MRRRASSRAIIMRGTRTDRGQWRRCCRRVRSRISKILCRGRIGRWVHGRQCQDLDKINLLECHRCSQGPMISKLVPWILIRVLGPTFQWAIHLTRYLDQLAHSTNTLQTSKYSALKTRFRTSKYQYWDSRPCTDSHQTSWTCKDSKTACSRHT